MPIVPYIWAKLRQMTGVDTLILELASKQETFTLKEAYQCCHVSLDEEKTKIRKRLSVLASSGKLVRKGSGTYALSDKPIFRPNVSNGVKDLYESLKSKYPFTKVCVYEGPWISPLLHHMASNQIIYIDVEKDASEFVFDHLKSDGVNAYYKPDEDMVYRYINLDERNVFVKNLVSEAPLQKIDGIPVSTLEKILVDIYCDQDFSYLQGSEYVRIAENAMTIFNINKTKLLRYAKRRGVKEELEKIYNEL